MIESSELHDLELTELATRIRRREVSPLEVVHAQLQRIATLDPQLASFAHVSPDLAIAQAEQATREIAAGKWRGPLHGIPIGLKDLCWTRDLPTAAGTSIYRDWYPANDATVVQRLKEAGAVLLGKLQLTEGAYSDHHPSVVAPKNPWNPAYWPGISSSGPGVAIAAGLCHGAIGSDTGGSIRWPCAANGITGLKPTWGRVSRYGVFELAPSLDHVGPMARSVADCAVLLKAIAGADVADPTALLDSVPDYTACVAEGLRGLRIGVDRAWNEVDVDASTQAMLVEALGAFRAMGGEIVEVSLPEVGNTSADWFVNCAIEASVAHEKTYPARADEYGPVLAAVLDAGRAFTASEYQAVVLRRMALRGKMSASLAAVDAVLMPVQPFAPLSLETIRTLGEQPQLIAQLQRYTCPFDMTGHPTLTLPGAFSKLGLPMGFQLVAAHLNESTLIRIGAAFQRETTWHRHRPSLKMR
ncbi:MAG TPA: amidase [Steroidobacteraceae bacterium]|nr:amidase [Steroidobacteraceae bacterium]